MRREIDLGRALVLTGAVAVLIGLFLEFYDVGVTGWEAFESLDLVIAALAIGSAIALLRPGADGGLWRFAPFALLVILISQLVEPPPATAGADPDAGFWVALAGSLLMTAGAVLALARVAVRIDLSERRSRVSETDAAPAPPAPAPGAGERLLVDDDAAPPPPRRFAREPETTAGAEPAADVREVAAVDRRRQHGDEPLDETQPLDARPE